MYLSGSIVTDQWAELDPLSRPQCSRNTVPEPPYTYPPLPPSPSPPPPPPAPPPPSQPPFPPSPPFEFDLGCPFATPVTSETLPTPLNGTYFRNPTIVAGTEGPGTGCVLQRDAGLPVV